MKFLRVARALGAIFKVYSFFFLIPLVGSLYWDEHVGPSGIRNPLGSGDFRTTTVSFALTFLAILLLGYLLTTLAASTKNDPLREREAFFVVGAGWFFCAILGAIPFLLAGSTRNPLVALFESMSGITTTGFSALEVPLEQYPESIHIWRGTLHFFGGLGIILVAVAVLGRLTEGAHKLMGWESSVGEVTQLRPKLSQTAKTLFGIYVGLNLIVFLFLWFSFHLGALRLSWKQGAFEALVTAFGTIASGGFSTRTQSVEAYGVDTVRWIVFFGMVAAGINFALYFRLLAGDIRSFFRDTEFHLYITMMVLAIGGVAVFLLRADQTTEFAVVHGAFQVVSAITCTGYTSTNADAFPDGAKLVLLLMMLTGGMVGSTSGAIKIHRINVLLRLVFEEIRRLLHPHAISILKVSGRVLPDDSIRRIVVFFFTYVTVFVAGAFAFGFLGFDLQSALSASAATLGNVGYGFGQVSSGFADASEAERLLAILLMWVGRLEIFTALLLLVPATYRD